MRSLALQAAVLSVLLAAAALAQCPTPEPVRLGPTKPTALFPGLSALLARKTEIVQDHWSEVAKMVRPPAYNAPTQPPRDNCPHVPTATNVLRNWHDASTWPGNSVPVPGQNVTIPANTKVLISSCSVRNTDVYGYVKIPAGSELVFNDANVELRTMGIEVYGALRIGSATCRIRSKVIITLHGSRSAQRTLPAEPIVKGIYVDGNGVLDLHGVRYYPTWTRLAATASPGDTVILVQDVVNWQPGQSIIIATTEVKDSRDWHRNEVKVIQGVFLATAAGANVAAITLTTPLSYLHYGGKEYQAEVGLLTRNVVIRGDEVNSEPTDNTPLACSAVGIDASTFPCPDKFLTGFGGHVQVAGQRAIGRVEGVEFFRMGQTNMLARYPIHFHMMGQNGASSYITDSAVHRSFYRCYSIHGTHNSLISENVAYDAIAHCYYLEDGIEENNTFSYNFGAHVHFQGPVHQISLPIWNDFTGQRLEWIDQSDSITLPADFSASPFYITNAYNSFIGNSASGGFASYAFPGLPNPLKLHSGIAITPRDRPLKLFKGNVGHSTGYWWASAGAIYIGGTLQHKNGPSSILTYNAGRSESRATCNVEPKLNGGRCPEDQRSWMRLEDTKVFLVSGRGLQHWGDRSDIIRLEVHDAGMSMNVFGAVYVTEMLMECRSRHSNDITYLSGCTATGNLRCNARDNYFFSSVNGFQWYDIHQRHIVTNSVFRNCNTNWPRCIRPGCPGSAVWTLLTHSDAFVPEMMQISKGIKYENVNLERLYQYSTNLDARNTISGRLQNWLDFDGSASLGIPGKTQMGSAYGGHWWRLSDACVLKQQMWLCPWTDQDYIASILFNGYNTTMESELSRTICLNGYFTAEAQRLNCPVVGKVTHFGRNDATGKLDLGANARITGAVIPSSGGWAIQFNGGTSKNLRITYIQVDPSARFVIALPYPPGTTFNIFAQGQTSCRETNGNVCRKVFEPAKSIDEVRYGDGSNYFFDSSSNWLYLRIVQQKSNSLGSNGVWNPKTIAELDVFEREGLSITSLSRNYFLHIQATCQGTGEFCSNPPNLRVPPALGALRASTSAPATTRTPTTPAPVSTTAAPVTTRPSTTTSPPTRPATTAAPATTTAAPTRPATTAAPATTTAAPTRPATTAAPATTTAAPTRPATTAPPSTTQAPRSSAAPVTTQKCSEMWGQCGGRNWSGAVCCIPGSRCLFGNEWYSQCVPM